MNASEIASFVLRYLEAAQCHIIEKTPGSVTVKLSPEADKALTGRSYYWSFVERTGAEPETMTLRFVFDPEKLEQPDASGRQPGRPQAPPTGDSILGRYFGIAPVPHSAGYGGVRSEHVHYGSKRLEQLFDTVRRQGRFVQLFESAPEQGANRAAASTESRAYTSWLAVNYKVEYICDMKRDELHPLGISLSTGEIVDRFYERISSRRLVPKLPANSHIRRSISLDRALEFLEREVERRVRQIDHTWAQEAQERLAMELESVDDFYTGLLNGAPDETAKADIDARYETRKQEIEWQYKPRILVSAINCGIFHLWDDTFPAI